MPFVRVNPHDTDLVAVSSVILEAARAVDDPDRYPIIAEAEARELEFGWDLEPDERYLYLPLEGADPVGVLDVQMPRRDNRHLVWAQITVQPGQRRRGHGTAIMAEVIRRANEAGRPTIWIGTAEDDLGARAFLERFGFRYASHDARRRQVLAEVDWATVDRLAEAAREQAADYRLERLTPPYSEELLTALVEVTAAINDAPMGELTYEDEHFDVQRIRDVETATAGRGDRIYRVIARHTGTGEIGGHTVMVVPPFGQEYAFQGDTAVSRAHRGHRLGLLVKVEMMRWLREVEPQVRTVETFNHADNAFMISVNESIGYRLSRVFAMYELNLDQPVETGLATLAEITV